MRSYLKFYPIFCENLQSAGDPGNNGGVDSAFKGKFKF